MTDAEKIKGLIELNEITKELSIMLHEARCRELVTQLYILKVCDKYFKGSTYDAVKYLEDWERKYNQFLRKG